MKKKRLLKNLSVEELAKSARTGRRSIYDWERDLHSVRPLFIKQLADALETTPEYILGPLKENASLAEQVKYYLICRGLSQAKFAQLLGVDRETIVFIEQGRSWRRFIKEKELNDVGPIPTSVVKEKLKSNFKLISVSKVVISDLVNILKKYSDHFSVKRMNASTERKHMSNGRFK